MAKAKRGRKPKGDFSGKLSNFSTRIQPETRKALEHEAKVSGQSISQVAERLLKIGLAERQAGEKDRAMRALCFLIAQLAHHVVGPHVRKEGSEAAVFEWRNDPFFYAAFKLAVGHLLDALSPGPIENSVVVVTKEGPENPAMQRYVDSFKTPEARAEYAVDYVLNALRSISHWPADVREEQSKIVSTLTGSSFMRELYGMPDAWKDLAPKPQSGKAKPTEIAVQKKLVLFGDTVLWSGKDDQ
jgi:hypothetical protein